jgi:translocator assembly and maintenance protein 41
MHKPIRIIKDDARVRLTQQVNLVSALRVALLTLPDKFHERQLFERISGFSYAGDPRMFIPGGENRGKVANIVSAQTAQFRELYQRLANGLPGVHWHAGSSTIEAGFFILGVPIDVFSDLKRYLTHSKTRVIQVHSGTR